MKTRILLLLFISFILLTTDSFSQGCSQCKMLAEQGAEVDEGSFGSTINSGILYLMTIPYLILMFLFRERIFRFVKGVFKK
jgi:hypothetical protein